jgi:hypothetical protein
MNGRPSSWLPIAVGPSPCETGCPNVEKCKAERLACAAFSEYVLDAPWLGVSIEPNNKIYNRIFSGEENGT